jgi:hypothetical protein
MKENSIISEETTNQLRELRLDVYQLTLQLGNVLIQKMELDKQQNEIYNVLEEKSNLLHDLVNEVMEKNPNFELDPATLTFTEKN